MTNSEMDELTCVGCGAKLTSAMRYCVACYRPVDSQRVTGAHSGLARELSTTRRPDPAIVFLPDVHEAMVRKRTRRKRSLIAGAIAVCLMAIGSFAWLRIAAIRKKVQETTSRQQMAQRELSLMADALERFKQDIGRYPTTDEGIPALLARPSAIAGDIARLDKWSGPYMDGDFEVDPWGHDYVYQSNDGDFLVFSYGPEGETGSHITLAVSSDRTPPK